MIYNTNRLNEILNELETRKDQIRDIGISPSAFGIIYSICMLAEQIRSTGYEITKQKERY